MTTTERPPASFYVQHLLGIGHIARASRVANALQADGFDVTLVTGACLFPVFQVTEYAMSSYHRSP